MAVGDLVGQTYTSTGAGGTSFQPASGVTVCIVWFIASANNHHIYGKGNIATASTIQAGFGNGDTSQVRAFQMGGVKFFIDNGAYLGFYSGDANGCGFTGVQTT